MIKITAKPLTLEKFAPYGQYVNLTGPSGAFLGNDAFKFYRDPLTMSGSVQVPMAFSSLEVNKAPLTIPCMEYHNFTAESMLPLDDDAVLCVSPANGGNADGIEPEAFIVSKGTMVRLNIGVWHYVPLPANADKVHVLIVLPERTYLNDLAASDFAENERIEITL